MGVFKWLSGEDNAVVGSLESIQALEASSASLLILDGQCNIVVANKAAKALLGHLEGSIKARNGGFSVMTLIGSNISALGLQASSLQQAAAQSPGGGEVLLELKDRNIKVTAVGLKNVRGETTAYSVELIDNQDAILTNAITDALNRVQAVIQFYPDGTIITANENFCGAVGYDLEEIQGQHHRIFCKGDYTSSQEYKDFWRNLARGQVSSGEFCRIRKDGSEIWINASYNPVYDESGKVIRVVKFATDITDEKIKNAYYGGQIEALNRAQAVIEFNLDGTIINANENFLGAMGYSLEEIQGKHHSMFVDAEYKKSPEYRSFWEQLGKGIYFADEFKRINKAGDDVWIQASYNPIFDQNGKPYRVVKYAVDITARVKAVQAIRATMQRLVVGDLDTDPLRLDGDFAELGNSINQFVQDNKRIIGTISDVMSSMSAGDLTQRVDDDFQGEFQVLANAINSFAEEISGTIRSINEAVDTINTASSEIATGNADLSSRTEQQASSLEETASAMEELTGTVRLNAENAEQANMLASQASKVANEGGDLIRQVVDTMGDINASAQEISDIIGVIDGIAFQTNILALNAAVEAARAGEQGRGFAVVASEVRTLAQRSAEAAKEIKELISDSVGKINGGNQLVNKSGDTMAEVVNAIQRVNDIMSEISAASSEQATSIEEVGKAVNSMDEMTQQNAALVEEAAAAADSLQQQAIGLTERVAMFKLDGGSLLAPPPAKRMNGSAKPAARMTAVSTPKALKPGSPSESEWETF
ncbi:methyl-accepting chemotaxis protein [Alteromonas sp. 1_MG-2023]|uniref:methyl-accepting chemotaxis protein n=1 Tax=Alteromonas sp. 1_MG-2023 TaxID=3062669 RepID=UPI0026E183D5|nr:methyl-accepting chemotaxis protein [Alteromonas sp. 1_MG-2023]MDO6473920.1 methyl-accepting chemotaxis protein [Alteromonas sp. 1_MG-2023]